MSAMIAMRVCEWRCLVLLLFHCARCEISVPPCGNLHTRVEPGQRTPRPELTGANAATAARCSLERATDVRECMRGIARARLCALRVPIPRPLPPALLARCVCHCMPRCRLKRKAAEAEARASAAEQRAAAAEAAARRNVAVYVRVAPTPVYSRHASTAASQADLRRRIV